MHLTIGSDAGAGGNEITGKSDNSNHPTTVVEGFAELTSAAEELRNEDDDCGHKLTLAAEETTTGANSSFNDGSSNADSEIDSSQRDIDTSDSEHEGDSKAGPSSKQDSDECEGLHNMTMIHYIQA